MALVPETHVLALDQAPRRIGYAIGNTAMLAPLSGAYALPSVGARHGVMLKAARDWLHGTIVAYQVTKVCFESPFKGPNPSGYALQNKLIGVIEELCAQLDVACVECTADQWRLYFIGVCRGPKTLASETKAQGYRRRRAWLKDQAMLACASRNWDVKGDDEAEACGILAYCLYLDGAREAA